MTTLTHILSSLERYALRARDLLYRFTKRDRDMILLILLCAVLLRMPMLDHPSVTQFDEVIYTDYALHIIHQMPLLDIHPPLARMIFAEAARTQKPFSIAFIPLAVRQSFGDFPYVFVRFIVACFGVLLPLLLYGIARALRFSPRMAAPGPM